MSEPPTDRARVPATPALRVQVRDSRETDIEAVCAIYAHHVRHGTGSFELEPPSLDDIARRRSDVLANGFAHRVAEIDGEVAGYSTYGRNRVPSMPYSGEIFELYLSPQHQGMGLGRRLFGAARRELADMVSFIQ